MKLHAWTYGRVEIKARIKTQEGLWPTIWMLGNGHEWPSGGENLLFNLAISGTNGGDP
ncbi:MAG: family 16 glycosylhydrolase [Saprospiraceae bacterium]